MHRIKRPPIQALALIGVAGQGAFVLVLQGDSRVVPWILVASAGVVGLAYMSETGRHPPLVIGAALILIGGFILLIQTDGVRSLFLPWYVVLVAVYPLLLPRQLGRLLPAVAAGMYSLAIPFTDPPAPPELVPTRVFILLLIGYLALSMDERSRRAEHIASRGLRYEQAVAEATRILNEGKHEDAIEAALNALLEGTEARSVFVEMNSTQPGIGLCTSILYEAARARTDSPTEGFWTDVPWSTMPVARRHMEAGEVFAFRVEDLGGTERAKYEHSGIKSEIDIPIFVEGTWVGLIGVSDDLEPREWDEDDIAVLQAAASAIAAFLERRGQRQRLEELAEAQAARIRFERAIAESARVLLMNEDEQAIDATLHALGQVMQAQKIFVDENFVGDDDRLYARVTHEYIRPGYQELVDPEIWFDADSGKYENYVFCYDEFPEMRDRLAEGHHFTMFPETDPNANGSEYGDEKVELNIPILVSGRWAGSIGFTDYLEVRNWEEAERALLHTAAALVGAFWERQQNRHRLEELVRSKDEFVASVSHELRTPLTAVVGLAHELRENGAEFDEREVRELIALIADQSLDVANIVEDLLVSARAETGGLTIIRREVDLRRETESVLAGNTLLPAEKVSVSSNGNVRPAWADATRVRQILRNLLTNAVRYGGERVRVTFAQEEHTVVIRVHDSGNPIPADAHDRIFKPYQRAHNIPSQPASVGLGLSVSLQLAELMDGSLTYFHTGDESVFTLTLPAARRLEAVR
ncbi:MAG: GAF domain-containing sensor histidine kinase [Acidimicrobiia bacterium]|nr:GAF domain-containing sensor histidine kinase [Acidimicrobiia bacterium]